MHVIICGGGVIGCNIAYYLSLRKVSVTIVESNAIACGASGKAGGYLAKDWSDHSPLGPLSRKSFQLHHDLARILPSEEYGFRTVDTLSVSMTASAKKQKQQAQQHPHQRWCCAGISAHTQWRALSCRRLATCNDYARSVRVTAFC